ncbi:hypothetical protein [Gemmobacter denitrificans]|uniref:Uncharacterized protein n=1 Tax=Gemmobacter denitrificans TaxID=3123040 RepID=A0ABU8BPF3_9RHOB
MRLACLFPAVLSGLCLAAPAAAATTYEGRDQMLLHCAGLLLEVSERLTRAGHMTKENYADSQALALLYLAELPGSERDRVNALKSFRKRVLDPLSFNELSDELDRKVDGCKKLIDVG